MIDVLLPRTNVRYGSARQLRQKSSHRCWVREWREGGGFGALGPLGRLVESPDRRAESWVGQCRDRLRDREAEGMCAGKVNLR